MGPFLLSSSEPTMHPLPHPCPCLARVYSWCVLDTGSYGKDTRSLIDLFPHMPSTFLLLHYQYFPSFSVWAIIMPREPEVSKFANWHHCSVIEQNINVGLAVCLYHLLYLCKSNFYYHSHPQRHRWVRSDNRLVPCFVSSHKCWSIYGQQITFWYADFSDFISYAFYLCTQIRQGPPNMDVLRLCLYWRGLHLTVPKFRADVCFSGKEGVPPILI
jgi:hypothetical protein